MTRKKDICVYYVTLYRMYIFVIRGRESANRGGPQTIHDKKIALCYVCIWISLASNRSIAIISPAIKDCLFYVSTYYLPTAYTTYETLESDISTILRARVTAIKLFLAEIKLLGVVFIARKHSDYR